MLRKTVIALTVASVGLAAPTMALARGGGGGDGGDGGDRGDRGDRGFGGGGGGFHGGGMARVVAASMVATVVAHSAAAWRFMMVVSVAANVSGGETVPRRHVCNAQG
ncbi:hypothetical protein [Bradyrhizobium hipponense]|uniref:hypothetical protein n=1 Tax=Bradyrhizobium hipponense TaxID=2605638 RepID=UPI0016533573|nr:hypothetical protein [Bradyrhizobium hipponense]